jgi:hypothetical protein
MADDNAPESQQQTPDSENEAEARSASRDLADGLELMLRAARKAVSRVNAEKVESAGRRVKERLENLDARKVGELGKKAAKNLDPRQIEEIAEDAGKELLSVIERVADRVEAAVAGSRRSAPPPKESERDSESEPPEPRARVRVDDKD